MKTLNLVKIVDTSGKTTGLINGVTYQALTDEELDNLYALESGYSYISRNFKVEEMGEVQVPSWLESESA